MTDVCSRTDGHVSCQRGDYEANIMQCSLFQVVLSMQNVNTILMHSVKSLVYFEIPTL